MKIIKLSAIDSTNSFLKELIKTSDVENYTVVITSNQTKGKGQRDSDWVSEPNKNLTFSILIKGIKINFQDQKFLNFAISLAILRSLEKLKIPQLKIKWPNDILSYHYKLCGILIENNLKKSLINWSVIGIGLNVNQVEFPENLHKVSSLKKVNQQNYDLDSILELILKQIKIYTSLLADKKFSELEENYLANLYKKDQPAMFKDSSGNTFLGIIRGVSNSGNLKIELENETLKEFGLKEIAFV